MQHPLPVVPTSLIKLDNIANKQRTITSVTIVTTTTIPRQTGIATFIIIIYHKLSKKMIQLSQTSQYRKFIKRDITSLTSSQYYKLIRRCYNRHNRHISIILQNYVTIVTTSQTCRKNITIVTTSQLCQTSVTTIEIVTITQFLCTKSIAFFPSQGHLWMQNQLTPP